MTTFAQALALGATLLISNVALADFNVCNKSKFEEVFVAFGYHADSAVSTRGWFKIEKDNCGKVYEGDLTKLDSNLFYLYGITNDQKAEWKGKNKLCVKIPGPFEYKKADGKCKSGEKRSFRRFTADDQKNFTITLGNAKGGNIVTFGGDIHNDDIASFETNSLELR